MEGSSYQGSDEVDISVQRDDDWIETIRIKKFKLVSDLLEASRSRLNFEKHDQLSAHKIPTDERIPDSVRIRKIAHLGTVVIKCEETRANHEDSATQNKYTLAPKPVKQDGYLRVIRHRDDWRRLEEASRDSTTAHQDEITYLNSKLEAATKVKGFVFKIVSEDYKRCSKESDNMITFFSLEEYQKKRSDIRDVPCWCNWQPGEALPCCGARIKNKVGKGNPSERSCGNRNQETSKVPKAIVTRTSFHQVREFGVNVTINKKAVKEAKRILETPKQERQKSFRKFNDKYCSFVYSGKFFAGAWLRTVAKASCWSSCTRGQEYLEKCAAEETEHWWSRENQRKRFSSYQSPTKKDPGVVVFISNVQSDPPGIQKMYQLEEKLTNVRNCTVFPANWDEKSHFTPVYEIMQSQAEANNDDELRKVSDVFKECMKEEETIEKMGTQTTAQETYRGESSKNMYTTDYSPSGNWYGPSGNNENRDWKIRDTSLPFSSDYRFIKTESEATLDTKLENIPAKMTMGDKPTISTSLVPYVVFLGDTGTGKSTIVEKLTGEKERSSNESESFTSSSGAFVAQGGKLIVADTPGSNCRKDKEEQNIWIAGALNFQRVSRIFIVSKAQPRIDSVINNVCKYADNFVELPLDVIGVLVSHMDMVEWGEDDFMSAIDEELGIDAVIFSSLNTTAETLLPKILDTCKGRHDLTVNHVNFAKLFKIPNNHIKILKFINDEVKKFTLIKEAFDTKRKGFHRLDQTDLAFEFLTYMLAEIADAEKKMIKCNNFTFKGDSAALEAGHVLNMVNQLHTVLLEIRKECFKYQCEHGVSEFRKCPYCGLVWTKKESCSGSTTCGNEDSTVSDAGDEKFTVFDTFAFAWESDGLTIEKKRKRDVNDRYLRPMFGCGKTINWKDMATVELRSEFKDAIRLFSSGTKVDPSRESFFRRISERTREFAGWMYKR